jgi:uncharacterized protein (TIGR00725 family)
VEARVVDTGSHARPYIAVVGPSEASARERTLAEEVGALLARQGAVVLCGGLGGVMEACARGASMAGGVVLGVLPGFDRTGANPYLTVALATGLGELRNGVLVNAADALVAVGGSWGTFSEVTLALHAHKPVVALRSWSLPPQAVASPGARLLTEVTTAADAVRTVLTHHRQNTAENT